jgi:hypothetical protein
VEQLNIIQNEIELKSIAWIDDLHG